MTWDVVARKDFEDAIRSRWLWVLSALFVGLFALPALLRFYFDVGGDPQQVDGVVAVFIWILKEPVSLLVPIIAIVVAYPSIIRERTSGTLKLLLALPHARSDVVLGKLVGRSAVVAAPILLGFVASFLIILPAASGFGLSSYVKFALLTALLGVVFVAISVSISAVASNDRRAMVGTVGTYLFMVFLWNNVASSAATSLQDRGYVDATTRYLLELTLKVLNPVEGYKTLVDAIVMSGEQARINMFGFFIFVDPAAAEALEGGIPAYVSDPFVVFYMLLWMAVPLAVGIHEFRARDL